MFDSRPPSELPDSAGIVVLDTETNDEGLRGSAVRPGPGMAATSDQRLGTPRAASVPIPSAAPSQQ
jgi:hypothetical protein